MNLTPGVARLIRGARRLGYPGLLCEIPEREIGGFAYGIAYLVQARLWLLRTGAARWARIHDAWRRSLEVGAPAVRAALSGTLDGDHLRLLSDGCAVPSAQAELYASAGRTIDIATYYIQADDTGWNTARRLEACVRRGVRVRLLADRRMIARKRHDLEGMDELFDFLRRAGVEVRLWHDPERPFDCSHRKMILVDEDACVVGGRNFADHYQDGSWRDVDVVLVGPTARRLATVFEAAWREAGPRSALAAPPWFEHVPARVERDPTVRYVLACIEAAERTLDLEVAYFAGVGPVCDALAGAARRGVRVRLLTNSADSTDLPFMRHTTSTGVQKLMDAGASVFLWRGHRRTLHCKYVVADGAWVSLGSHNLNNYSSRFSCEVNLHVHSERLGQLLTGFFERGRAESTPADREQDVTAVLARTRDLERLEWILRDFQ